MVIIFLLLLKYATWLRAQTAGTFKSNRAAQIASLSCCLDALADSVSAMRKEIIKWLEITQILLELWLGLTQPYKTGS